MAENPQFETLTQSLSPTLQSLEQKRKELKKQGQSTGIWVGGVVFVIVSAFSVYINAALIGVGIAAGLALLAYYSCVNAKSQELSSYYKQKVIAKYCNHFVIMPSSHRKRESKKVYSGAAACLLRPTVIIQKISYKGG